jgi:hypothetical protein
MPGAKRQTKWDAFQKGFRGGTVRKKNPPKTKKKKGK